MADSPETDAAPAPEGTEAAPEETTRKGPPTLHDRIVEALKTVYDPEIPVDIYELGLIYDVDIDASNKVALRMTLTAPGCPVAGTLPGEVEERVRGVQGVQDATVELVWDPPWGPERMSEIAKLELGMFF